MDYVEKLKKLMTPEVIRGIGIGILIIVIMALSITIAVKNRSKTGEGKCPCIRRRDMGYLAASVSATVILVLLLLASRYYTWLLSNVYTNIVMVLIMIFGLIGWGLYAAEYGDDNCECTKAAIVGWNVASAILLVVLLGAVFMQSRKVA